MSKTKCVVPDCRATSIHLRGLCRSCYIYAASLVLHGIVTWYQLEAAGCIGPAGGQTNSPRRPERTAWFAKGAGMDPVAMAGELRRRVRDYGVRLRQPKRKGKE